MTKAKNKWGFLAPTRAKAEEMEKKYGVHFTPLIDYMKVIFPDIDDWEEEKEITISMEMFDEESQSPYDEYNIIVPSLSSHHYSIMVAIGEDIRLYRKSDRGLDDYAGMKLDDFDYLSPFHSVYLIDSYTQLTNATVKQIFGIDVAEPLFDENTPTLTQPWMYRYFFAKDGVEDFFEGRYVGDEKQYQVNFDAYQMLFGKVGISKIIVKNLFDLCNYEIDLNTDENISILIGPNGCGKTTILKIVRFMLSGIGDIEEIMKIPFKSITCELVNGRTIKLEASDDKISAFIDEQEVASFGSGSKFMPLIFDEKIANFVGQNCGRNTPILNKENIANIVVDKDTVFLNMKMNFQKKLKEYNFYFNTEFISAQRLLNQVDDKKDNAEEEESVHKYSDSISEIKKQFKHFCEEAEAEYNKRKAYREHCLLKEYIEDEYFNLQYGTGNRNILDDSIFWYKWQEFMGKIYDYESNKALNSDIEDNRQYFAHGFDIVFTVYKDLSDDKKEFLNLYLEKFTETLDDFGKAHEKTMLFQDIINDRLKITQKQLQYRFGEMYLTIGRGRNKKEIPLEVLSSGEKNDFIMFYNLIFNCKNSKIFVDEPEISLHIEWQERYIDDLLKICKMNNIQALVATHSPNIINDHTDLLAKWEINDER